MSIWFKGKRLLILIFRVTKNEKATKEQAFDLFETKKITN